MSATGVEVLDTTIQKTHVWLKDMMEELGWEDRHKAYVGLRATLQALRDRLPIEEVAHLGAQLPMLIRGMYYEGWDPTGKPLRERRKAEFLAHISRAFRSEPDVDSEAVAGAALRVLERHVSGGEIEQVKHSLPAEIRGLWV